MHVRICLIWHERVKKIAVEFETSGWKYLHEIYCNREGVACDGLSGNAMRYSDFEREQLQSRKYSRFNAPIFIARAYS